MPTPFGGFKLVLSLSKDYALGLPLVGRGE